MKKHLLIIIAFLLISISSQARVLTTCTSPLPTVTGITTGCQSADKKFIEFSNLFNSKELPINTKTILIEKKKEISSEIAVKYFSIKDLNSNEYYTYNFDEDGKKYSYKHQTKFYALYRLEIGEKQLFIHAEKKADSIFIYSSIFNKDGIIIKKLSIHGTKGEYNNWASVLTKDSLIKLYTYKINWNSFNKNIKSGGYELKKDSLNQTDINIINYKLMDFEKVGKTELKKGKFSSSEYYFQIKKDDPYAQQN